MSLGPLFWLFGVSLKTKREFATDPFGLPPGST